MEVHVKRRSKRRRRKNKILWVLMICTGISAITICTTKFIGKRKDMITPEEVLLKYMGYIQEQNYTAMYQLIDVEASGQISEEDFVKRNSAIYEGIEVQNMEVTILSCNMEKNVVQYQTEGRNIGQKWACPCRERHCVFCGDCAGKIRKSG